MLIERFRITLRTNGKRQLQVEKYRVSQKFVPLITRDITFDRNYTSARNFLNTFIALLSTYVKLISGIPSFFFITFRSRCGMEWDKSCRVESGIFFQACLSRLFRSFMWF